MAKSRSKNQDGKGDKVFDIDMSSGFDDAWQKSRDEGIVDDGKSKSDGWFSMRELLEEQSKKRNPIKNQRLEESDLNAKE